MFFQMSIERIGLGKCFPETMEYLRLFEEAQNEGVSLTAKETMNSVLLREYKKIGLDVSLEKKLFSILMAEKRPGDRFNGKTLFEFLEHRLAKNVSLIVENFYCENMEG